MNQAIHTIDLVRWIGGPVSSVMGHVATLGHEMEAEDTASVSLRFASGALGSIVATTCVTPEQPVELRVYGDAGHVRLVGEDAVEWDVPGDRRAGASGRGATAAGRRGDPHLGHERGRLSAPVRRLRGRHSQRACPRRDRGRRAQRRGAHHGSAYEADRTGRAVALGGGSR